MFDTKHHKSSCIYYNGTKPCAISKDCHECNHYKVPSKHILIILLGRLGDVLMATALLETIALKHPNSKITWITEGQAIPLLENNPYVHRVLEASLENFYILESERFDLVINLDRWPLATSFTRRVKASCKKGFTKDRHGSVVAANKTALYLLDLNRYPLKRSYNNRSWVEIYHALLGVTSLSEISFPKLYLKQEEILECQKFREHILGKDSFKIIGLSIGSHIKDQRKRWPKQRLIEFVHLANEQPGLRVIILAGPHEEQLYKELNQSLNGKMIDTGLIHNLRQMAVAINACDVIVTNDSLNLHIAMALDKPGVAIFGADNPAQVQDKKNLIKLRSHEECPPCHSRFCKLSNSFEYFPCIAETKAEIVMNAVLKLL